jgi:hypothetical protein
MENSFPRVWIEPDHAGDPDDYRIEVESEQHMLPGTFYRSGLRQVIRFLEEIIEEEESG